MRANQKEMILDSHGMKVLFLVVMRRVKAKYAFRSLCLCVHRHFPWFDIGQRIGEFVRGNFCIVRRLGS
jgi:hypothetical protein